MVERVAKPAKVPKFNRICSVFFTLSGHAYKNPIQEIIFLLVRLLLSTMGATNSAGLACCLHMAFCRRGGNENTSGGIFKALNSSTYRWRCRAVRMPHGAGTGARARVHNVTSRHRLVARYYYQPRQRTQVKTNQYEVRLFRCPAPFSLSLSLLPPLRQPITHQSKLKYERNPTRRRSFPLNGGQTTTAPLYPGRDHHIIRHSNHEEYRETNLE